MRRIEAPAAGTFARGSRSGREAIGPYTTVGIGLLGTKPSQEAIESSDPLFLVGTSFPYIEYLPKPGQARAV